MPGRQMRWFVMPGTLLLLAQIAMGCDIVQPSPPGPVGRPRAQAAEVWLTTGDQSSLLARQPDLPWSAASAPSAATIRVVPGRRFQTIDGFGAALTGASASLLNRTGTAQQRSTMLRRLFDPVTGAGLSYVRVPLGPNDFSLTNATYDDMPSGQSDWDLSNFSIASDRVDIIPVLRAALAINPRLKIMATPWTAPAWMKTSGSVIGGTLDPNAYDVYARYLVRSVQAYAAEGIELDAMTVQNEPGFSPPTYPGMTFSAAQEGAFVKNNLGPALRAAGLTTKLIGFDHNWDGASYPKELLADPAVRPYLAGTAFHCYGGDPSAQTDVHDAYPNMGVYFTECTGGAWSPDFGNNLAWNTHTLLMGAVRNWAKTVLLWNLALDEASGPTNGGCSDCRGVLTINRQSAAVSNNVEYYALAHVARFVKPDATRIDSTASSRGVESVAFQNPDGSTVLVLLNTGSASEVVSIDTGQGYLSESLPGGAVATLTW